MVSLEMDRLDHKIILALREDGRISNVQLAEQVNLSPSQCLRRVRRLEESGVISGYRADINYEKLGFGLVAWVLVMVSKEIAGARDSVMRYLQSDDSVQSVYGVTGDVDLMLEVRTRDMAAFTELVIKRLYARNEVVSTKSYIRLDTAKRHGVPVLE